ncbi:MAG: carboxypeptidase regulatory-like domain-containing protein [Acidobacteria bacterium]|nr:carboxypeptidase regulatory-like domain-containing protein [Acidobacteriota bacterium]
MTRRLAVLAAVWAIAAASAVTASAQVLIVSGGAPGAPSAVENTGDGVILGRVVDGTSRRPVAGALVALGGFPPPSTLPSFTLGLGQPGQPLVLSDADGRFVFRDLAEARYSLLVQAPGYLPGAHGSRRPEGSPGTITLGRGETRTDVEIPVWKAGSISGVVLDELGEPVVEVPVRLLRRSMVRGRPGFTPMGGAQTDDRGIYRVANLAPGDYVVFVPSTLTTMPASVADAYLASIDAGSPGGRQGGPAPATATAAGGLSVGGQRVAADYGRALTPAPSAGERFAVYPSAFHPAAADPQSATVISVGSGEERLGVDVRTSLVPSYTIEGMVAGPAGPVPNATVSLMPQYTAQLASDAGFVAVTTSTDGNGRFTVIGATPGDYVLRVTPAPAAFGSAVMRAGDGTFMVVGPPGGPAATDQLALSGELQVAIQDRDLAGIVVNTSGGATVSGRVEFVGRAKPPTPAELARGGITLIRADGQMSGPTLPARLEPNGTFRTSQYRTGPYTLSASVPSAGWYLRSVRIGGREMIDHRVDLTSDLTDVVFTFGDALGELAGTARPAGGPASEVSGSVVLFPADYREWITTGMGTRRARRVDVAANGTFEIHNLLPGDYLAAAVTSDSPADLQDPAVIDALARIATPVSVPDGQRASLSLSITRVR